MIRKLAVPLALAAIAFVSYSRAFAAGSAFVDFQAKAHILDSCSIAVADLDFGAYDPVGANASTALTQNTSITLTCTRGTPSSIDLGPGANYGAVAGKRTMINGAAAAGTELGYDLFQPDVVGGAGVATTTVWGTAAGGSAFAVVAAGSVAPRTVKVFGSMPAGQDAIAGNYADTVRATVNF